MAKIWPALCAIKQQVLRYKNNRNVDWNWSLCILPTIILGCMPCRLLSISVTMHSSNHRELHGTYLFHFPEYFDTTRFIYLCILFFLYFFLGGCSLQDDLTVTGGYSGDSDICRSFCSLFWRPYLYEDENGNKSFWILLCFPWKRLLWTKISSLVS